MKLWRSQHISYKKYNCQNRILFLSHVYNSILPIRLSPNNYHGNIVVRQGCFWHDFTSAGFYAGAANHGFLYVSEKGSRSSKREVLLLWLWCRICWRSKRRSATKQAESI